MDPLNAWQRTLGSCARLGLRVIELGQATSIELLDDASLGVVPASFVAFAQSWQDGASDPWEVLLNSVRDFNRGQPAHFGRSGTQQILGRLFSRAQRVALTVGTPLYYESPNPWALLAQIPPADGDRRIGYLLLHPPITDHELQAAQMVLGRPLPPSYVEVLAISNGIGLDPAGRKEVFGAGPQRADWGIVLQPSCSRCQRYHELAARWRSFHHTYEYEHEMDAQAGTSTFLSDERNLVPYLQTNGGDSWCFDSSDVNAGGEYSLAYWDHERREITDHAPGFSDWFDTNLEALLFPEQ